VRRSGRYEQKASFEWDVESRLKGENVQSCIFIGRDMYWDRKAICRRGGEHQ
jgi:hypothetical protein